MGEKQQELLFKRLLAKNENNICADCKSKGAAWASLDFGVFICINCSGVHRSFGMHVTRVRSTKLDSWTVRDYKVFETVGNSIANLYWEHKLTTKSQSAIRGEDDRQAFIKNKYQGKNYVFSGKTDPVSRFIEFDYNLTQEELKSFYNQCEEQEPVKAESSKKLSWLTNQKTSSQIQTTVQPKKNSDCNLLDFDIPEMVQKPAVLEKAKSSVDPFTVDFLNGENVSKPINSVNFQEQKKPQSQKVHSFETSDFMFDFTKNSTTNQVPHNCHSVNTGNVFNINNLTVYNQSYSSPNLVTPQQPQFNGHLDRYSVFDTFKLNYQNYGYHN